jgi:hypothetical protein
MVTQKSSLSMRAALASTPIVPESIVLSEAGSFTGTARNGEPCFKIGGRMPTALSNTMNGAYGRG